MRDCFSLSPNMVLEAGNDQYPLVLMWIIETEENMRNKALAYIILSAFRSQSKSADGRVIPGPGRFGFAVNQQLRREIE